MSLVGSFNFAKEILDEMIALSAYNFNQWKRSKSPLKMNPKQAAQI